ncbi:MAG: hypothetical protein ACOC2K_02525, partial [Bacteroidota bacterium]
GTDIETVEYSYTERSDMFWQKAEFKDSEGRIIKLVRREFNEKGLPVLEKTEELGTVVSTVETEYCPHSYYLLEKTVYNGEAEEANKTERYEIIYDKGVLEAQVFEKYSDDPDFVNADGNNIAYTYKLKYLPTGDSRPKGYHPVNFLVESSKEYFTASDKENYPEENKNIGDVFYISKTDFTEDGIPVYSLTEKADCEDHPTEQWFKAKKDDYGRLLALEGYSNKELTEHGSGNTKMIYNYDGDKLVSVEEYKFNEESSDYDLFHDAVAIEWKQLRDNDYKEVHNLLEASSAKEHYCYHRKLYSVREEKVVEYNENHKVIEHFQGSYEGDFTGRKADKKLIKKVSYKTEKIQKSEKEEVRS